MTEAEWLTSTDAVAMLAHLDRPRGDRKLLLTLIACCRRYWHLLTKPASRAGVEWAELYADGFAVRDDAYSQLEWDSEAAAFAAEDCEERMARLTVWGEWVDNPGKPRPQRVTPSPAEAARHEEADLRVAAAYLANKVMFLDCLERSSGRSGGDSLGS